jgi:hypothetical protein
MKAKFILLLTGGFTWLTGWAQVEVDKAFTHAQTLTTGSSAGANF